MMKTMTFEDPRTTIKQGPCGLPRPGPTTMRGLRPSWKNTGPPAGRIAGETGRPATCAHARGAVVGCKSGRMTWLRNCIQVWRAAIQLGAFVTVVSGAFCCLSPIVSDKGFPFVLSCTLTHTMRVYLIILLLLIVLLCLDRVVTC